MNQSRKRKLLLAATVLVGGMLMACSGGPSSDTGTVVDPAATASPAPASENKYGHKFGETIKFRDGSTLTVGKPAKFTRDRYSAGGENSKLAVKFKATFKNNTDKVFDPALTTAAVSAGGEEGDPIYQDGLDAPDNKVLPGKSVTWWMGYGVNTTKDLQLQVDVGFLDYGTVIFTA